MNYLEIDEQRLALDIHGFLVERKLWNKTIAQALAQKAGINLTPEHWQIIEFLRGFYQEYHIIPPLRIFIKNLKEVDKDLANSIKLHSLFPESPLKYACMIAGLPKPKHCM